MPELSRRHRQHWDELARVDDLFDRWMSDWFPFRTFRLEPAFEVDWRPAVDVIDKKDHILVKASVPGVKKEDIDISLTNDSLTIKGKMEKSEEEKSDSYYRSERIYGTFGRVLRLPSDVNTENVKATLKDGILELTLHKREEKKPSEIKIEVN